MNASEYNYSLPTSNEGDYVLYVISGATSTLRHVKRCNHIVKHHPITAAYFSFLASFHFQARKKHVTPKLSFIAERCLERRFARAIQPKIQIKIKTLY